MSVKYSHQKGPQKKTKTKKYRLRRCLFGGKQLTIGSSCFRLSTEGDLDNPLVPHGTSISSCAGRLVPVSEHLPESSSPFRHTGTHQAVEFCSGGPPTSPATRPGGEGAGVLGDQVSVRRQVSLSGIFLGVAEVCKTVLTPSPSSPTLASSSSSSECYSGRAPPGLLLHRGIPN